MNSSSSWAFQGCNFRAYPEMFYSGALTGAFGNSDRASCFHINSLISSN